MEWVGEGTQRDQWLLFETTAEFGPAVLFEEVTVDIGRLVRLSS